MPPIPMKATIKADAKHYDVRLHDLAVLFLHDPKYPLLTPLYLYFLALTDKQRRGQLSRILGTHAMNSDAIGKLFGVSGSAVRRTVRRMLAIDLLRYHETVSPGKDGQPPIKRRHYTVMAMLLTKKAVALSKDIARSNKLGVIARRMNVDPPERLVVCPEGLVWQDPSGNRLPQGFLHAQRKHISALYPTAIAQVNKEKGSIYSGVTPEKHTSGCHIDVTTDEAILATPEKAENSPVEASDASTPTPTPQTPANGPPDAIQGQSGIMPTGVNTSAVGSKIAAILAAAHNAGKLVDPVGLAMDLQEASNMSDDERLAVNRIRNWGLAGPDEAALIHFVTRCKVYPSSASGGKASRGSWMAVVQAIANESAMGSFQEACDIAIAKASRGNWMISSPLSIKPIAVDVARLKRLKEWVDTKTYITKMLGATPQAPVKESDGKLVYYITEEQRKEILDAKTIPARKEVYERILTGVELLIKGNPLGPVNEVNFIGPAKGIIRVK